MTDCDAGVEEATLDRWRAQGVEQIVGEIEANGTAEDKECLHYILHEAAGSNPKLFPNSRYRRDHTRNGETLRDFVNHRVSQRAKLSAAQVCARGPGRSLSLAAVSRLVPQTILSLRCSGATPLDAVAMTLVHVPVGCGVAVVHIRVLSEPQRPAA